MEKKYCIAFSCRRNTHTHTCTLTHFEHSCRNFPFVCGDVQYLVEYFRIMNDRNYETRLTAVFAQKLYVQRHMCVYIYIYIEICIYIY